MSGLPPFAVCVCVTRKCTSGKGHMMKQSFAVFLVVFGLCTSPASAQSCGTRDVMLDRLASHYGETRRGMGLGSDNGVMEMFASDDTGSWTITVTRPDGRMCLVASGDSYEQMMDPLQASEDA
jgi:hypothetical protein